MWRTHFEGGYVPVVRQNTECMNELIYLHVSLLKYVKNNYKLVSLRLLVIMYFTAL
jgi:hypothetical protein